MSHLNTIITCILLLGYLSFGYAIPILPNTRSVNIANTSSIFQRQNDKILCSGTQALEVPRSGNPIPTCIQLPQGMCTLAFQSQNMGPADIWVFDSTCCHQFAYAQSVDRARLNNGFSITTPFYSQPFWIYVDSKWDGSSYTPESPLLGVSVTFYDVRTYPINNNQPHYGELNGWSWFMGQFPC